MKQDLRLKKNADGIYDLSVFDQNFKSVDGFETAIIVSLFTDDRAPASNVATAFSRRGWVGNILTADVGRGLGSILWLYEQSRITRDIINQIEVAANNCLAWMVEDGIAKSVSASVANVTAKGVSFNIEITTVTGETKSYSILWDNTRGSEL